MQTDHMDVLPYHTAPWLSIKTEGKEEDTGTLSVMAFVIPSYHYRCQGPALDTCLVMGSSK